ncbi:MAG: GerAB/ArcD/ProY family transporter [Desulfitobacteriaceae bacterium]
MEKISSHQFTMVSSAVLLGTTFFPVANLVIADAGRDGWWSVLPAYGLGIPWGLMILSLGGRYPGKNLLQITEILWGKWVGKIIGVAYLLISLYFCALLAKQGQDVVRRTVLTLAPSLVILAEGMIVTFLLVKAGIEVYARFAEVVFPLTLVGLLSIMVLVIPRFEWEEFLPVWGNGVKPILQGILKVAPFPMEYIFFLAMLLPFLSFQEVSRLRSGVWRSVLFVGFFDTLVVLTQVLVFGPKEAARLHYGLLTLANMVEISKFVSGIEAIFMMFWIGNSLLKVGALYFCVLWAFSTIGGWKIRLWLYLAVGLVLGIMVHTMAGGTHLALEIDLADTYLILPFGLLWVSLLWLTAKFRGVLK